MISEYLNQPVITPEFHPLIIMMLLAFGICLAYAAWTDYKTGILLPNLRYWLFPGILLVLAFNCRALGGTEFGSASSADFLVALIVCLMYYLTAWKGILGGADFWGCALTTCMLCYCLGWPAFLIWVFIALVFIPAVCRTTARIRYCRATGSPVTWEIWRKSNWAVKKSFRLLPAVLAGYIGAIITYIGAWYL